MFTVRKMSVKDFSFAVSLTDTMNWDMADEDFEFMTQLEPEGCLVLLDDSEKVGIATTISFGELGWLGNVIVRESNRGRGSGSTLVKHAIEYLKGRGVKTIGLYGYIERIPFYFRHGFVYDSEFIVLKGGKLSASPSAVHLREVGRDDFQDIVALDSLCFGASRRRLLERILLGSGNLCYVYRDGGQMLGFVMAKVYEEMAEVGPLVCARQHEEVAVDLLKAIVSRLKGLEASICVLANEPGMITALKSFGFREDFHLARMFHGPPVVSDCVYVAESLERG